MKRQVLTVLSVLSLLLCIGVAAFWVRSYLTTDVFRFGPSPLEMTTITIANGTIGWVGPIETRAPLRITHHFWRLELAFLIMSFIFAFPEVLRRLTNPVALGCLIALNHISCLISGEVAALVVFAMDGVLVVCWLRSRFLAEQRRSRVTAGLCFKCGYDLRATAEKCPECVAACEAANPAGESPVAGD